MAQCTIEVMKLLVSSFGNFLNYLSGIKLIKQSFCLNEGCGKKLGQVPVFRDVLITGQRALLKTFKIKRYIHTMYEKTIAALNM